MSAFIPWMLIWGGWAFLVFAAFHWLCLSPVRRSRSRRLMRP